MVVFRDTPLVIVQTSKKIVYLECGCPKEPFLNLLKSSSKDFPFVTKYLVHLSFLCSVFIWLLINACKLLLDHMLTYGKQKKGTFNF